MIMRKLPFTASCLRVFIFLFAASGLFAYPASGIEQHQQINGLFRDARDVTIKCLECHRKQAEEVLQSSHWSWKRQRNINGKATWFGKKDSLTGFGIDVGSNPDRCMSCHVSNTPHNINFDSPGPDMVDCLVCHDTTNTYPFRQSPLSDKVDLQFLARNVGIPAIKNCTTCHFADCGLTQTGQVGSGNQADVHMTGSAGFRCQSCHLSNSGHSLTRKMTQHEGTTSASPESCISCHSDSPHAIVSLNRHTGSVSCQTCHIPVFASDRPALISWNWLLAGKSDTAYRNGPDGRLPVLDQNGVRTARNIEPVYLWDDGNDTVYTRGQRIQPRKLTYLQKPGERTPGSRIAPFRVIYATQLYDTKYRYLISPLLTTQGNALFPASKWNATAGDGMKAIVLPYSGQHGFIPTVSYKRINHGVAPAAKALDCLDCHGSTGRMPWDMLGYDQDPMIRGQAGTGKDESLGQNSAQRKSSPPVQESLIPNGYSY